MTYDSSWITIRTTSLRWEAELMQQVLLAQQIPTRILDAGMPCIGMGSPAAVQVPSQHVWSARLLLSPVEDDEETSC